MIEFEQRGEVFDWIRENIKDEDWEMAEDEDREFILFKREEDFIMMKLRFGV